MEFAAMSTKLLPCPFCGAEAHTWLAFPEHDTPWFVTIEHIGKCVLIDAMGGISCCATEAEMIEAWNLRSKPVAGVEVKPLGDWRRGYCDDRVQIQQQSFGGLYQVRVLDGVVWLDWPNRTAEEFATVEHAKAAAEADYRQCILSTLSLPAQEPTAYGVFLADGRFMDIASDSRDDAVEMAEIHYVQDNYLIRPLYASPQPEAVLTEEMVERAISQAEMWNEEEGDPADTLHHGRSMIQKFRAALTAALKEA